MSTQLPEILEDFFGSYYKKNENYPPSYLIVPLIDPSRKDILDHIHEFVHVPFKSNEIYLLHKAFVDSGGAPAESYKSLFDKTASRLANKTQKGFSSENLQKASDRVDPEARENVKRFLQKMIRNIDSY